MADVRIINFAPFREGTPSGKAKFAAQIREACEGIGFFCLAGHSVPRSQIDGIFAAPVASSI